MKGDAEASVIKATGEAAGEAYERQATALGKDNLAQLEITRAIGNIKIPLVPQISLGGSNGQGGAAGLRADLAGAADDRLGGDLCV